MHFSLVLLNLPNGSSVKAFDDAILPMFFGLRRLGYNVEILQHAINPNSRNILFGSTNNPTPTDLTIPSNAIVMNLEQLSAHDSVRNQPQYLDHLRRYEVWDYSKRNIEYLSSQGIAASYLPFGYVPEMTRLVHDKSPLDDVLFYGAVNSRRQAVLDGLIKEGVQVNIAHSDMYGRKRDAAIALSRICLNIHYYYPATLEVIRLGYLWANRRAVVSEVRPDTELFPGLEDACTFCAYEELIPTIKMLLADESRLLRQAERGYAAFSGLRYETFLETVVGRKSYAVANAGVAVERPNHLHIGSGSDFRNKALNIDINADCNPDIALDISKPLLAQATYATERFGHVKLTPGSFEKITAYEVLEHVSDLPQTMRNFLDLLRDGGELTVTVPYDLSCGAWQDPTHVRGFNENSWLYYTQDSWYLGWNEYRFEIEKLLYKPSSWGKNLLKNGKTRRSMLRIPRAVDGMLVVLRKVKKTPEEIRFHSSAFRGIHTNPSINWEVDDEGHERFIGIQYLSVDDAWWRQKQRELWVCTLKYYFCKHLGFLWMGKGAMVALKKERKRLRVLIGD